MTPEEQRKFYPKFLADELERFRKNPELNKLPNTKITDFFHLIRTIWVISNKKYQEKHWIRQESPMRGDNYMETMETFLGDSRAVLDTSDYAVEMTQKQNKMLQEFCNKVDAFWDDPTAPGSEYGENDEAIVNDVHWDKVREYAKLVYEELSGDDLDIWEKKRK